MDEQKVVSKRRTPAQVQHLLSEFRGSGMGQAEFCHSRGISRSTLYRYLSNRRRQEPAAATQLVPVEVVDVRRSSGTGSSALAVVLGNGRKIEVGQGFDAATLQQLVGVLERG